MQTIHRQDNDQESIALGGRLLYLRTPQFQGEDVEDLQTALGALGFSCGGVDVSVPDAAEDSPEFDKSAHHHAIALLDAFCVAFS